MSETMNIEQYITDETEDVRSSEDEDVGYCELHMGVTRLEWEGWKDAEWRLKLHIHDWNNNNMSVYKYEDVVDEQKASEIIEAQGGSLDYVEPKP